MTEQVQNQEVAQEQPQAPATPDLTVNDLQALKTIIDVASQRGTFKANELASVGQVYNRLEAFLNHIAPKDGAQGQAPAEQQ